jgi:protein-tyrosine phosphatase
MWIELEGLANLRDVGGLPTSDGGKIIPGRLLRSDNLQDLTADDVDLLLGLGLSDIVDLRSDYEIAEEGPTRFTGHEHVRTHAHSMFREWRAGIGEDKPEVRPEAVPAEALPWVDLEPAVDIDDEVAGIYFTYLVDRPDSVVGALRDIASAPGAVLVHCAAGKDRTGTIVALALTLAGVGRDAIVADYAASSERVEPTIRRLLSSPTYAGNLEGRPMSSHLSQPSSMAAFLDHLDSYGGVERVLTQIGWTAEDTDQIRAKLRD